MFAIHPGRAARRGLVVAGVVAIASLLGAGSALAAPGAESGDAGSSLQTAQKASGQKGTVDQITGQIAFAPTYDPATGTYSGDADEDLYAICLTGGAFEATTVTGTDPMLWLFNPQGVLVAWDDDSGGGTSTRESKISLSSPTAGLYYLGISSFANKPVNENGVLLDVNFGTLSSWNDVGDHTFAYTVDLVGAKPAKGRQLACR